MTGTEEIEETKESDGNVKNASFKDELSLESLQVQVDKNRAEIVNILARTGTPKAMSQAEVDKLVKQAKAESAFSNEQRLERTIRRHVKRTGGYRKGITEAEKTLAGRLLKKLGRDSKETTDENDVVIGPAWDTSLLP